MEMLLLLLNSLLDISEQDLAAYVFYFEESCTVDQYDIPIEPKFSLKSI